jgi:molybdopterin molybdotransferase
MISVEEALSRILAGIGGPIPAEEIPLTAGLGRVLAEDVTAGLTQPPVAVSAMDGYAVRAADVARVPARLTVIGVAPAGRPFHGSVRAGEAVRIFTGAPVPEGADAIVIQEDTDSEGTAVIVREGVPAGRFIRPAGLDFQAGSAGLTAGKQLTARDIGLAAAMNRPWLRVRRRPRVAILSTGDELVNPGETPEPGQIVSSNAFGLAAFVTAEGGEPLMLGISRDDPQQLLQSIEAAAGADLLLTSGGASVGEHDLIANALAAAGMKLDFWKIAMRPGKPLLFGRLNRMPVLGLPGNPVSSLVCSIVFLRPALAALLGRKDAMTAETTARLGRDLPENDRRQEYLRSELTMDPNHGLVATPFERQDSVMLSLLVRAGCLVVRPPHAAAARAGEAVRVLRLDGLV